MSDKQGGVGTAGKRLKTAWRKAGKAVPFRKFVRALLKEAGEFSADAKTWLASKLGKLNTKRSEANVALGKVVAAATKASRKPTKK